MDNYDQEIRNSKPDGLYNSCKACEKKYYMEEVNRERCKIRSKMWRIKNIGTAKAASKAWYDAHKRRHYTKEDPKRIRLSAKEERDIINSLKIGKGCVDCGDTYAPHCMDFDHVRGEKHYSVSQMLGNGFRLETILDEIKKCDLVCANCHRIRTDKKKLKSKNRRRLIFNEKIALLKSKPCFDCARVFSSEAMEFDHVRGEKITEISHMHDAPWSKVLAEIAKCDLICSCCHRKRTKERRGSGPLPDPVGVKILKSWHKLAGTMFDGDLSKIAGISKSAVTWYRHRMGIPSFRQISWRCD